MLQKFMTSRELTAGFDFWSRGHFRMAMMHLPIKFGADIFTQSEVIVIFPILKMAVAAILDLVGEPWDHPRRRIRGAYSVQKFRHDRLSSFRVIKIWIFCHSGLKVLFTPPKFQCFGGLYPKIWGNIVQTPKRQILARFHVFWSTARKNPSTGLTCRLIKEKRLYFTHLLRSPQWMDFDQIWYRRSLADVINYAKFFCRSVQVYLFSGGWNLPIPIGIEGRR